MEEYKSLIKENLRKYRKESGITQTALAKKLGVRPSAVSNWENGPNSIDADTLFQICNILNVPITKMIEKTTYGGDEVSKMIESVQSELGYADHENAFKPLKDIHGETYKAEVIERLNSLSANLFDVQENLKKIKKEVETID